MSSVAKSLYYKALRHVVGLYLKVNQLTKGGNMELLKAVNIVLPYLSEHPITRIAGTRHPTVDLILGAIDSQRMQLLAEGLWFNRYRMTIPVNTDGMIDVPKDALAVYGVDCDVEIDGDNFFDLKNVTRYFTKPITVDVIIDKPFEKLPLYAAMVVTYAAAMEVYLQDYGNESVVGQLQRFADKNRIDLDQEHLRKSKFNNFSTTKHHKWRVTFR